MPPWLPEEGELKFADELRLSTDEIARIQAWADQGAPEGDPADLPAKPKFAEGWQLGKPDVIARATKPLRANRKRLGQLLEFCISRAHRSHTLAGRHRDSPGRQAPGASRQCIGGPPAEWPPPGNRSRRGLRRYGVDHRIRSF